MSNLMKHQSFGSGTERNMKMMNNNIKVKDLMSTDHHHHQLYGEEEEEEDGGGVGVGIHNHNHHHHNHHVFSWPPRSYTCSFCKREFRSAQALGGHMNVHRRDRARLRQSSPPPTPTTPSRGINVISSQPPQPQPKYSPHHHLIPNLNLDLNPNMMNFNPSCFSSSTSSECHPPPPAAFMSSTLPNLFSTSSEMRSCLGNGIPNNNKRLHLDDIKEKLGINNHSMKRDEVQEEEEEEEDSGMNKAEIIRLELEIGLLGEAKEDLDLELRLGSYTTTT